MMRSLYSGVAGLKAHQTGMDVVGNNIANVNTTGFKSFRATYQDTLYQTSSGAAAPQDNKGGVNPMQVGLGVGNASIDKMFKDGSVQATSSNTDLCLSGDGLFIVKDGSGVYYTRNGAFKFDGKGNYVNSAGQYVQGWMGVDGEVNTNSKPGLICIPSGKPMASKTTTLATYANNLNAADPTIVSMSDQDGNSIAGTATIGKAGITALSVAMSDGTTQILKSGTYTLGHSLPLTTTLTAYDSLGNAHTIAVTMEKTGTDTDCWEANLAGTTVLASVPALDAGNKTVVFKNGDAIKVADTDEYQFNVTASTQDTHLFLNTDGKIERGTVTHGATQLVGPVTTETYVVKNGSVYSTVSAPSGATISAAVPPSTTEDAFVFSDGTVIKYPTGTMTLSGSPGSYVFDTVPPTTPVSAPVSASAVHNATVAPSTVYTMVFSNNATSTLASGAAPVGQKIQPSSTADYYIYSDGSVVTVSKGAGYQTMVEASDNDTAIFKTATNSLVDKPLSCKNDTLVGEVAADSRNTVIMSDGTVVKVKPETLLPNAGDYILLEDDGSITTVVMDKFNTQFKTDGSYDADNSQTGSITLIPRNGAAQQTITIDTSGLTQYAGSNTVNGDCDGNAAGTLVEVNIDSSGTITGTYSNSIKQKEAVVAVAQFNNAGGLTAKGASLFQKSNNSGEPNVKTASDLGCTITASALEMSNVDLANEFSTMIVTQRGYQSNSKVITVSDEMLETLIQMKR